MTKKKDEKVKIQRNVNLTVRLNFETDDYIDFFKIIAGKRSDIEVYESQKKKLSEKIKEIENDIKEIEEKANMGKGELVEKLCNIEYDLVNRKRYIIDAVTSEVYETEELSDKEIEQLPIM